MNSAIAVCNNAFYHCENLTSITIPDSVKSIYQHAFEDCKKLTPVEIPDSVKTIGEYAFEYCSNLTSVTIPDSVKTISEYAFSSCYNLEYKEENGVNYLGNDGNPHHALIKAVDTNITSCEINENCKVIASGAFIYRLALISVTIPDSVTSIGSEAFDHCEKLGSITIPCNKRSLFEGNNKVITLLDDSSDYDYSVNKTSPTKYGQFTYTHSNGSTSNSVNFDTTWTKKDDETHGHKCTQDGCTNMINEEAHTFNNAAPKCDKCDYVAVDSVTLDPASLTFTYGDTNPKGLTDMLNQDESPATNQNVKWSVSPNNIIELSIDPINPNYITVRALNVGDATITVTTSGKDINGNSKTANCTVTVNKANPDGSRLNLTAEATYGDTLATIKGYLIQFDNPLGIDALALDGSWSWVEPKTTLVGDTGIQNHCATFIPDSTNYNLLIGQNVSVTVNAKALTDANVTLDKTEFTYDGNGKVPTVTAKDGEQILTEGKDYDLKYYNENGDELPGLPIDVGTYTMKITFQGNYKGIVEKEFIIEVDKSTWGTKVINSGVENYVLADGTTSAEVSDKNGIIWVKEESYGTSAWYGLNNSKGTFRNGSRFWGRWLNKNSDPEDFDKYYNQLDEEYKKTIDNDRVWIFLLGVTDPDSNEYVTLSDNIDLYIELGEDWDKDDISAVFINEYGDETLSVTHIDGFKYPEGNKTFAKVKLYHLSPYAIYDKLNTENPENENQTNNSKWESNQGILKLTGDSNVELYIIFSVILVSSAAMLFIIFDRKRKIK